MKTLVLFLACLTCLSCHNNQKTPERSLASAQTHDHNQKSTLNGKAAQPGQQISEYIRRIFKDSKGNLWLGTNSDGVARYDGKKLEYFSLQQGLAGFQVTGIAEDKKGNMWFSTNTGISKFNGKLFTNFTIDDGLPTNTVWSIYVDSKNIIWAGTPDGVYQYDENTTDENAFRHFEVPKSVNVKKPESAISSDLVWCFKEDENGNMWMGTDGYGLVIYNPKVSESDPNRFRHITENTGLCNNCITSIAFDNHNQVWLASFFGGISLYDQKTFTNFNATNSIGNNECWTVFSDKSGNIWFSSEGFGIYKYDTKRNDKKSLINYGTKEGLGIGAVQSMYEDEKGRLWFGGGGGLYRKDGDAFVHIKTEGPWE